MTTKRKPVSEPELIIDVELEDEVPGVTPDPRMCACVDVDRRWDGDGLAATEKDVNYYTCSACGKWYSA